MWNNLSNLLFGTPGRFGATLLIAALLCIGIFSEEVMALVDRILYAFGANLLTLFLLILAMGWLWRRVFR